MKKLLFIVISLVFLNCNFKKEKTQYPLIEQAQGLLGNWENQSNEENLTENWEKLSDSTYIGESIILKNNDTLFHENILLEQRNDSLFYIVSLKNQEPITFYATKTSSNEIEFSNPKHDFPNLIRYKFISKDSLLASIHGKIRDKIESQVFPMKKAK